MSKPRNDWWTNAINIVRNYPSRKQEYEELHRQSFSSLSGVPGSGNISNPTERLALMEMPPMKQKEYDAVNRAVQITNLLPHGDLRVELIRRMYWRGKKVSIDRASCGLNISEATAKRWHIAFINLVGQVVGYQE